MRFLAVLSVLVAYTAYKVQDMPPRPFGAVALTLLLFALMLGGSLLARSHSHVFEHRWFSSLSWLGSLTLGFWATCLLLYLPLDLVRLMLGGVAYLVDLGALSKIFSPTIDLYFLYAAAALSVLGFLVVLQGPKIRNIDVPVEDLDDALRGLKLIQLSDLHVGPTIRIRYIENVVRKTNAAEPDLVLITGDIADARADSIAKHLEPLRGLRARHGVYYVTGNHEYYWGVEGIVKLVSELGIVPLLNENRVVPIGTKKILVAGVTDAVGGHFSPTHATSLTSASQTSVPTEFKLLLAHRPGTYLEAEKLGYDLQLSGHTHAGQFFPFSLLIGFAHRFYRGLHRHGKLWLYVNPGTGYWGPANRLGVRSEITLLTLG